MQITKESKEMAKEEKQHMSQKEASPGGSKNSNDSSPNNSQQNVPSVKQVSTPVDKCPLASRESSITPTLKQAPDGKDNTPLCSGAGSLSSGNWLKLKRKRLPSISKEPTIKLSRVDTENLKKAKPDQQKLAKEKCNTAHNTSINAIHSNSTISSSYKRYVRIFVC